MEKIYNKLVRDNIPEIIENDGEKVYFHILDDKEFLNELKRKLVEESREVCESKDKEELIEELADLYEVLSSILDVSDITIDEVINVAEKKKNKRGGFSKRVFLEKTKVLDK